MTPAISKPTKDSGVYSVKKTEKGARIWLDGEILARNGFTRGINYRRSLVPSSNTIRLVADPDGNYTVSGKRKGGGQCPVIDLQSKRIADFAQGADQVQVGFSDGVIEISISAMAARQVEREEKLKSELEAGTISEGTLCAGAGMATLALKEGLKAQGFDMHTDWVVDREGAYLDVGLRNNSAFMSSTTVINAPMEAVEPDMISPVSICQLSLPCTGQSSSGKAKNKIKYAEDHATDATAVYGMMKLLSRINAAIYVSENVVEAQNSATYSLIRSTLRLLGYNIAEGVLDSEQSGSIENRRRYWFVAVSAGLPEADWSQIPHYPRRYATLGEALDPIDHDDPMWSDNQYLKDKAEKDAAEGKGFKRQLKVPSDTSCGVINKSYAKRQSTPPYLVRPEIDDKERLFTAAEQARFKGCDPSVVQGVSFTTATEVLGQGIDMPQGRGIAEMLAMTVFAKIHTHFLSKTAA